VKLTVRVSALKSDGWLDAIAPGTELEIQVRAGHLSSAHGAHIRRRSDGVSPDETLRTDG
jgi:hypothetical protein